MVTKTDSKIEDFAEELGRLLGTAEAKARGWLGQRQQIAKTLEGIRDTANRLLDDLGHRAQAGVRRGRRAAGAARPGRPKKRRTMSAEAREKIRQAQLKRWAKQKASERK
jgi:hypothetical protein